ncbi:MAG: 1,4-alpha-glucan branching protein GlgB [Anaerolineae bacterium]|nr:1,4-alpha-glucan branching protein GlgB [Anaerolineae bacterium]
MAFEIHPEALASLINGDHGAPFELLGPHPVPNRKTSVSIRAFRPWARELNLVNSGTGTSYPMTRLHDAGVFEVRVRGQWPYHFEAITYEDQVETFQDPYAFDPWLTDYDLYLFNEGHSFRAHERLGAHPCTIDDVPGVNFSVWAPNAYRVSVIGDFNRWDARVHPMRRHGEGGVWELFIPGVGPGARYKYDLRSHNEGYHAQKNDPYGFFAEMRPRTASIVADLDAYTWQDDAWMETRANTSLLKQPMAIYEVHLGSWQRKNDYEWLTYRELADTLVPYARRMGYTHLELMPVAEHPLDRSWGYQVTGYFAPTSRYGTPQDFMYFVDQCHQHGLGVILDWVPAHFPKDGHALSYFDGTHLYEHADARKGEHPDWGTYIFNYGRNEVRTFLLSNAMFWLERYHIDGLRVDAVSSMLYLDFGRKDGEWLPNEYGGNENLDAISFLQELNAIVHRESGGGFTVAEESTAWPMVSRPTYLGGLGFTFKWNMGWMHDTLTYIRTDPVYRRYHHHNLTFSLMYAFSENFVLSLSHDEVVHGKGSLINKAHGDWWQKFATLRALLGYQYTHPGKKLTFMGQEFGQWREWSEARSLDWHLVEHWPLHQQMQDWARDLNRLYQAEPALHELDFDPAGFEWIEANDVEQSVFSYLRYAEDRREFLVVAINFTPVSRQDYRIGVPEPGYYREVINSDAEAYGGGNVGNMGGVQAEPAHAHGRPHSLRLTLPPLGVVVLKRQSEGAPGQPREYQRYG